MQEERWILFTLPEVQGLFRLQQHHLQYRQYDGVECARSHLWISVFRMLKSLIFPKCAETRLDYLPSILQRAEYQLGSRPPHGLPVHYEPNHPFTIVQKLHLQLEEG